MNIEKTNKLIAEFIGCDIVNYPTTFKKGTFEGTDTVLWCRGMVLTPVYYGGNTTPIIKLSKLKFHESFDWLIIAFRLCMIYGEELFDKYPHTNIHMSLNSLKNAFVKAPFEGIGHLYEAVVQFIDIYEANK